MEQINTGKRRLFLAMASAVIVPAPLFSQTTGYLRGAGDIRQIAMANQRTGESIRAIYWIEGEYVPATLTQIDVLFRDWRENAVHKIDTHLIDHLAATHALLGATEPYLLLSGFRTAKTNRLISKQVRGVAKRSLHMEGRAADVRLSSHSSNAVRDAAMILTCGGVGHYPTRGFTHLDCGAVRSWRG